MAAALAASGRKVELRTRSVPLERLNHRFTHAFQGRKAHALLVEALDEADADLIHYHVNIPLMGVFARRARRNHPSGRAPILIHVWNAVYRRGDAAGDSRFFDALPHGVFNGPAAARAGLKNADAVVVSSDFQHRQLREAGYRGTLFTVPSGVDLSTFRPAGEGERRRARQAVGLGDGVVMLYYGHLSSWKGVRHLVEALPSVLRDAPDASVLISHTAYGREEKTLRHRIQALGLAGRVIVRGPNDAATLLAAADLCVAPSVAAVGTACYPNVILESMAAGLPVVASRVGPIPEIVEHGVNGLLVPPADPPALAGALVRLATDADLRRRMGRAGRVAAEGRHDWNRVARRVGALYDFLLEGRRGRTGAPMPSPPIGRPKPWA